MACAPAGHSPLVLSWTQSKCSGRRKPRDFTSVIGVLRCGIVFWKS